MKLDYSSLKKLFVNLEMAKREYEGRPLLIFENEISKSEFINKHGIQKIHEDNLLLKTIDQIIAGFEGYRISSYQFL